jgi:hypothetical protein
MKSQDKEHGHAFKWLADAYRGKPVNFPVSGIPFLPADYNKDATLRWLLHRMGWKNASN